MSTSIDQSFVRQYERDVHDVFQRRGSKLLKTVRHKPNVIGKSTTFQKIGTGTATTKARHGTITPMNQDHTPIEVTLSDFYAGDWVDKLDEAKVNIDERQAIARGGANALGRKIDNQIITALDATTQSAISWTVTSAAAIRNALIDMAQALYANDVEEGDENYGVLTTKAWAYAMTVEEFASSDYVSDQAYEAGAPNTGRRMKEYLGIKWCVHTGLPGAGTNAAKVFVFNKMAVGYASQNLSGDMESPESVRADITWHGDRAAHFVNHMMSGGAKLIDDTGVIEGGLDDNEALPTS
jgi:hypothetical protein